MKKKNSQMSSSLAVGILLALAGGFMDAYSYMARGHVFANAQTGNILLFAVAISEGRSADSLRYLLPVATRGEQDIIIPGSSQGHMMSLRSMWQITTALHLRYGVSPPIPTRWP